ncbi:uncharacterized protein METZ01_LOCUS301154 [marine metagenome]|uniref:Uncharacterized protein n=1 Tax=marine metagenome TaxID=408172 RepID=A0A382MI32_9ZZZZ
MYLSSGESGVKKIGTVSAYFKTQSIFNS